MKTYLVGGAVRDALLGYPVKDRDWVVVGASPEQLEAQGFKPVGKDFPVFLHPDSHEEYALARTERKTAKGYHGFAFYTDPSVTLEQDLARRDLTINAMAQTKDGQLIDPFNGQRDIKQRRLRHVSPAFAEDPVRILRLARFAARLAPLGFEVADETLALMQQMTRDGEVDALVAERVWQELEGALIAPRPDAFIQVLRAVGALKVLLPEVDALFGVPQTPRYHPEVDTGLHTLMVLEQAAALKADAETVFACLCHDLGKALTPAERLPAHHGHEIKSARLADALCQRLKAPKRFKALAVLVGEYHTHCHRARELTPKTLLKLLTALDTQRKPQRFEQFLLACQADAQGRLGFESSPYPQAAYLRAAAQAMQAIDLKAITSQGLSGEAIKHAIDRARLQALTAYKASLP